MVGQGVLFDTHAAHTRARATDPDTSKAAAVQVQRDMTEVQRMVYRLLLRSEPSTDPTWMHEFRRRHPDFKVSDSSLRTRRAELCDMGKVRDSGLRVKVGRSTFALWEAIDADE